MSTATEILERLIEECQAGLMHFQVWWALRNLALPDFYDTMNDSEYVQFFHASNSGHYKLVFVALGKIFDSDPRSASVSQLKEALRAEGRDALADKLEADLLPVRGLVQNMLTIRNRTVLHNEQAITRRKVYEENGISANEMREALEATANAINSVADGLNYSHRAIVGPVFQDATLKMLARLRRGDV